VMNAKTSTVHTPLAFLSIFPVSWI